MYTLISICNVKTGVSLGCRWRRWPPDLEVSCKYIE